MAFIRLFPVCGVFLLSLFIFSCSEVGMVSETVNSDSLLVSSEDTYQLKVYVVSPSGALFPEAQFFSYYKMKETGDEWLGRKYFGQPSVRWPNRFEYATENQEVTVPIDATHVFLEYTGSLSVAASTLWLDRLSKADTEKCLNEGNQPAVTTVLTSNSYPLDPEWGSGPPECIIIH